MHIFTTECVPYIITLIWCKEAYFSEEVCPLINVVLVWK